MCLATTHSILILEELFDIIDRGLVGIGAADFA
jgi:hypothetical protein